MIPTVATEVFVVLQFYQSVALSILQVCHYGGGVIVSYYRLNLYLAFFLAILQRTDYKLFFIMLHIYSVVEVF